MVKKKINKKIVKTKSSNFQIPESFSSMNFKNKLIAVVLIALMIGVISSLFSGNITGMPTGTTPSSSNPFGQSFNLLKGLFSGVNGLVTSIFGTFFPGEVIQITYLRFILFALVIGLIYLLMKSFGSENPLVNVGVGIAIAYLSTFFIPIEAILTTGLLYSSTFMGIILFIPFLILWVLYFKAPRTKPGYILRIFFLILIYILTTSSENLFKWSGFDFLYSVIGLFYIFIFVGIGWSIFRAFFSKNITAETAEARAISRGVPILKGTIYDWIGKVAEKMNRRGP